MARFADMTVARLLEALAGSDPTPGGGTASAIAGALGTALLIMVTGLAKSRSNSDDEKAALAEARRALEPISAKLMRLADADTAAFDQVMAAYRQPKGTDEAKAARSAAIQHALKQATLTPLATLRACASAMQHAAPIAGCGNRSAASDVGVAIGLLAAAAAGAEANVRINLDSVTDEGFTSGAAAEASDLAADTATSAGVARQRLADR